MQQGVELVEKNGLLAVTETDQSKARLFSSFASGFIFRLTASIVRYSIHLRVWTGLFTVDPPQKKKTRLAEMSHCIWIRAC